MTPAFVKTTGDGPMLYVPETWGVNTLDALTAGAVRLSRFEVLSRFAQTEPAAERRVAGEIVGFAPIRLVGRIGELEAALTVDYPTSIERYRISAQAGWGYGVFVHDRFDRIEIRDGGDWVGVDRGALS